VQREIKSAPAGWGLGAKFFDGGRVSQKRDSFRNLAPPTTTPHHTKKKKKKKKKKEEEEKKTPPTTTTPQLTKTQIPRVTLKSDETNQRTTPKELKKKTPSSPGKGWGTASE